MGRAAGAAQRAPCGHRPLAPAGSRGEDALESAGPATAGSDLRYSGRFGRHEGLRLPARREPARRIGEKDMQNAIIEKVEQAHRKPEVTQVGPGDQVKVHVKIKEGEKERIQIFEGVLLARNNSGIRETITVRKISFGQGVERIFPLHAPIIEKIEVIKRNKVRRAKLYYLRKLKGKAARLKERTRR